MKKLILPIFILIPSLIFAMNSPSDLERKAEKVAEQMAAVRKLRDKETAISFLRWSKQPSNMIDKEYFSITDHCTPADVPLMRQLLEDGIIKVDAYCEKDSLKYTLLSEAIFRAATERFDDSAAMVELLLVSGAAVNQPGLSSNYYTKGADAKYFFMTPLSSSLLFHKDKIVDLLLAHKADPNIHTNGDTPFMWLVA